MRGMTAARALQEENHPPGRGRVSLPLPNAAAPGADFSERGLSEIDNGRYTEPEGQATVLKKKTPWREIPAE